MQALLYFNLSTGELSESLQDGSTFSFPDLTAGEDITLRLRFAARVNEQDTETSRVLTALRASIGRKDARPLAGTFKLALEDGSDETEALNFDAPPEELAAAVGNLAGLSGTAVRAWFDSGSWILKIGDGSTEYTLVPADNRLRPLSFVRCRNFQFDGEWRTEIRLLQAPVASTTTSQRTLPPEPSITTIRDGGTEGDSSWNELQKLTIPPDFRGTFDLRRGLLKTGPLDGTDTVDSITKALAAIADTDGTFNVANAQTGVLHIEFAGSMAGINQDEIEVHIIDTPEGDVTFTIGTKTAEFAALMRSGNGAPVKVPLEIVLKLQDLADDSVSREFRISADLTFSPELNWTEIAEYTPVNWLRPPLPQSYIPFAPEQVSNGTKHYAEAIGDGSATTFIIDHGLNTDLLVVSLTANATPGAVLTQGTHYTWTRSSLNSLTITLAGTYHDTPPAAAALLVCILALGQANLFAPHSHTIAEITSLQDLLDALDDRLSALEDRIPGGGLVNDTTTATGDPVLDVLLPAYAQLLPQRSITLAFADPNAKAAAAQPAASTDTLAIASLSDLPSLSMPPEGGLLPAVFAKASPPPDVTLDQIKGIDSVSESLVYKTTFTGRIPGGRGRRPLDVATGDFVAKTPAGIWYKLFRKAGTTNAYYPADFDLELCRIPVNQEQLRTGKTLTFKIGVQLALLYSLFDDAPAQWRSSPRVSGARARLVIEHATIARQATTSEGSSPDTLSDTVTNLQSITWNDTPLLEQTIDISETPQVHVLGVLIKRNNDATLTASKYGYGYIEAADATPPDNAPFLLRARLCEFDTENSVADPRGLLGILGLSLAPTATSSDDSIGRVTIK